MKRTKMIVLLLVAAGCLGALAFSSVFVVQEGQSALLLQFGRIRKVVRKAGLYGKYPFESVRLLDTRLQVTRTRLIETLTRDRRTILVQFYACWRVRDPRRFAESVLTSSVASAKIVDVIQAKMGVVLGLTPLDAMFTTRRAKSRIADMERQVGGMVGPLVRRSYGIEIVHLGVSRLAFSPATAATIFRRMESERKKIAEGFRAEGRRLAAEIRARATERASNIVIRARQKANTARSRGDRKAAGIYAEASRKNPRFFRFMKLLDFYRKVIPGRSTLVVSSDSLLFKYLNLSEAELRKLSSTFARAGTSRSGPASRPARPSTRRRPGRR